MTEAKPFQLATVEQALRALRQRTGPRRFLVADEVGLGKTVVAQHVIQRLMAGRRNPLAVFYVCSNLSIASQNQRKLLEVLPEAERARARCPVDRLTLLPAAAPPSHPRLHLYTLTPDTSMPMRPGRRRDGRQEERALIHALVEQAWPGLLDERGEDLFQRSAKTWWSAVLANQRRKVTPELQEAFVRSVRREFGLQPRQRVLPVLREREALDLIAHLRNALAAGAIDKVRPDLVIFDEFQRFRDLLSPDLDDAAERVIGVLRGDHSGGRTALLLLSATPYRMYSRRWEDTGGASHHKEFFDLVKFLWGNGEDAEGKRAQAEEAFLCIERELRKGSPTSPEAREARDRIEGLLRPVIARTERNTHRDGWTGPDTQSIRAELRPEDLRIFRHLSESLEDRHRSAAVPYWMSIPLPMQSMGSRYVAWKEARPISANGTPALREAQRDLLRPPGAWPHPRLRAMREFSPPERLALPWVAPSLPWWPLRGRWKRGGPEKALVFSRFRAVPQAVASLLSYDLEAALLQSGGMSYADVPKRRLLSATAKRNAVLALFHPSPWLVTETDPLASDQRTFSAARNSVRQQVKASLGRMGIAVRSEGRSRPLWALLAGLEAQAGYWPWVLASWRAVHRSTSRLDEADGGMGQLLQRWDEEARKPVSSVTPRELNELADFSLGSPGVVLGRALARHWGDAVSPSGFRATLDAAWNGLRNYLDQRWFVEALGGSDARYPTALRRAVEEGNLEAVLDEHLWIIGKTNGIVGRDLARELQDALQVRSGFHRLHPLGRRRRTFSLRCHAAMPFVDVKVASVEGEMSERPLRTDELRKAFNGPFWPHLLVTTSVGQEGLDFHVWCRSLIHWDLCGNPVDLEQREGRIQRFGGLSIRKAIAGKIGSRALNAVGRHGSPWKCLAELAEENLGDDSGLCPWWVCEGAGVARYVFDLPTSEQQQRYAWMQEQRLLYRLALGQPNQEDLVEILARHGSITPEDVRDASVVLSPWLQAETGVRLRR